MTGLSAQGDDGLGGFLVSDETSDLGDRSGRGEGRGEIDASTAELAVNGLVEDDANSGTSPVVNVSPALIQDGGTVAAAQSPAEATEASVTIADGGAAAIKGPSSQSVVFAGSTGTLTLDDAQGFTGQISGMSGADAIDLADISYGADTQVTFLGNAAGGTLTVTDGTESANIALVGDYLSSTWDLSSDGHGGVTVVDPVANTTWQTLEVGGGGYVRGLDVAPDGTMVGRTDTNGAYLWDASTSSWVQLVTASSMPAAFIAADPAASGTGVFEIQIADSNTQILYMIFDGYMFKSTNQGTTWTQQTSFNGGAQISADANDSYGQLGQKMAIDPNNPNIVYAGSEGQGMFVTTNGGTTWTSVSAIPAGDDAGITGILFDPGASAGVVGGVTQTIFASSYDNGVYESTNGGTTWSALTGGPSEVDYAAVSSTGVYYAADGNILWSYANDKWTQLLSASGAVQTVAVNPSNPNEIAVVGVSGWVDVSYNGGSTWQGFDGWVPPTLTSTDIPWLAQANTSGSTIYLDIGGVAFSPTNPNQLIATAGTGVWSMNVPPTSGTWSADQNLTWNDMSAGIENLVANEIIAPPGGDPVLASWDRPFFDISNLNAYPSTYGPVNSDNIVAGWSVDYASSNPSFIVGLADWWGTEQSGYSTDGGQTWTNFASDIPGADSSFMGGTIAASTPQNIIWAPADGNQPYYTLNGGATWNPITLPGVTSWSGFDWAYYLDQRSVTADRVLANTFYLYDPGQGVFETTNGGQSWTNVHPGYIESNTSWAGYNSSIQSVPGEAGNLFYTGGPQGTLGSTPTSEPFYRSTNGGATWTAIPNVEEVLTFGFGAAAPGQSNPALYIVGWVNNVFGIWQSNNATNPTVTTPTWVNLGTQPTGSLDEIKTISGDMNVYGQVYVGNSGGGYQVLVAPPSVVGVTAAGAGITNNAGTIGAGTAVTFTVGLTATVTVAGGAPTLSLNDGGTATYVSGSGTNALVFSYTVGSGQSTSGLAITGVNLPSGVTVQDDVATAAVLTGADTTFTGLIVGAGGSAPTITGTLAGQTTTSEAAVKPFSGVTIADANSGASDALTITVTGAGGTLSGTGLTGGTGGVYTLTGTAAAITSELDALSFTPNAGSPGTSSTTNFQLSDLSSAYATATVNTTTSVVDTDPAGPLSLSVAQATALETAGGSAPSGDGVTLSDTAANIEGLTAAQIGGLNAIGVTAIAATNASVSLTSAQAVALETAGLKVSAPSGDTVTLSDTAANIDGLTPTQITGLDAIGVTGIIASGAVILSVAEAMALETAGLAISDPTLSDTAVNDRVADGDRNPRARRDRRHHDRGDERVGLVQRRSGDSAGD